MTDPIADMLIRIKNAIMVNHSSCEVPWSNFRYELAKKLRENGFIGKIDKIEKGSRKMIKLGLKYHLEEPAIRDIVRVSRPGQRIYVNSNSIPSVKQSLGVAIISTSKGLLSGDEARKRKIGGELICKIW